MQKRFTTAGLILENSSGEILVLHRRGNVPEGNFWGLVGGTVEEENVFDSLAQKVKQEIDVDVNQNEVEKLRIFEWNNPNVTFHSYRLAVSNDRAVNLNHEGHTEYAWVTPDELYKNYPLMKGLYDIIEKIYSIND